RKLFSPDADAICDGGSPESASCTSGMKKQDTAAPWISVGMTSVSMSAWVLKRERIQATSANRTNETVANIRGSTRFVVLPTTGDSSTAKIPTGASTIPAWVAV